MWRYAEQKHISMPDHSQQSEYQCRPGSVSITTGYGLITVAGGPCLGHLKTATSSDSPVRDNPSQTGTMIESVTTSGGHNACLW